MTEVQDVPLGHLLTFVSRLMLCPSGRGGVLALARYLTQFPVAAPALGAAMPVCRHGIVRQHPWLLQVRLPQVQIARGDVLGVWAWLDDREQSWGATHPLRPLTDEDWQHHGHPRAPRVVNEEGEPLVFGFKDVAPNWL